MAISDEFYNKYFSAYDVFRLAVDEKTESVVSLPMHRAARTLSDTSLSDKFYDIVKGVEDGRIYPEGTDYGKRAFLKEQAGVALLNCGLWHEPHKR